jgi:hypothetical protein
LPLSRVRSGSRWTLVRATLSSSRSVSCPPYRIFRCFARKLSFFLFFFSRPMVGIIVSLTLLCLKLAGPCLTSPGAGQPWHRDVLAILRTTGVAYPLAAPDEPLHEDEST